MPQSHRFSAALACLAVVLHLLLAPLSGVLAAEDKRALGFGGHCETAMQLTEHAHHHSVPVAEQVGDKQSDDSTVISATCCCGASAVSLATLLVSACNAPTPPPAFSPAYQASQASWVAPRWFWPKLNPQAPPFV